MENKGFALLHIPGEDANLFHYFKGVWEQKSFFDNSFLGDGRRCVFGEWGQNTHYWQLGDAEYTNLTANELRKISPEIRKKTERIESTDFAVFAKEIAEIQQELRTGQIQKMVASRTISMVLELNESDTIHWFLKLSEVFPQSMVYVHSSPIFGTWIGASPETLCNYSESTCTLMSLAGTLFSEDEMWSAKEEAEQSITAKYIHEVINKYSEKVEIKPLTELQNGSIRHLLQQFQFELVKDKFGAFVEDLQPTPAVAGYPKSESIRWLNENSKVKRELYAGFLGMIEADKAFLNVNLRCAQITDKQVVFYAGCGINLGSKSEREWQETQLKSEVISEYLKIIRE
jgi:isochorismate synthase